MLMEYHFPPMPPEYLRVIVFRLILLAWALVGLGIVIGRLRYWKSVRPAEIYGWIAAATVSGGITVFGYCPHSAYDSNDWLQTVVTAALSVSVAGVTICLSKLYVEGSWFEKLQWFALVFVAAGVFGLFGLVWFTGCSPEGFRRSQCRNNLKSIGLGIHNYHDVHTGIPPAVSGDPPVSWRIAILPFLDERRIHGQYRQSVVWNHTPNDQLAQTRLSSYVCPTCYVPQNAQGQWYTAYSMLTGPGTIGDQPGTTILDITDGAGNTLMVVEACGAQIVWTEPRDVNCVSQPTGINLSGTSPSQSSGWISSYHRHGALGLNVDGSVRFLSVDTDPELLRKLSTINGGETLEE